MYPEISAKLVGVDLRLCVWDRCRLSWLSLRRLSECSATWKCEKCDIGCNEWNEKRSSNTYSVTEQPLRTGLVRGGKEKEKKNVGWRLVKSDSVAGLTNHGFNVRRPTGEEKIVRDIMKHTEQRPNSTISGSSTINSLADLVAWSIRTDASDLTVLDCTRSPWAHFLRSPRSPTTCAQTIAHSLGLSSPSTTSRQ